ncbi:MAG TPA: PD-(D/E)XK nuclease family protein [Acidimicrobiia bacterium]|nr:PD-(D/E)XK nuclease family protein [Acidimicrobiia bacterium]
MLRRWRRSSPRPRWHSVSSCQQYVECPRRYRYQYVDRLAGDRLVPAHWRYGTVVHHGLETAYRRVQDGAVLSDTLDDAVRAVREAWEAEDMPDDQAWLERAIFVVTETLRLDPIGPCRVLGVEHGFRAVIEDDLNFTGFADLVVERGDGVLEIIDHKVTRSVATPERLADDSQLNLYGWFALREWPLAQRVRASHHYPLTGETASVELSADSMQRTVDRLALIARAAQNDAQFAPNPGARCGDCQWTHVCEAAA